MLDSVPVPFQAILWPLIGAALILALGRMLPNRVRRLGAVAAALASLAVLRSLRAGPVESVEIVWGPLNFFRMSPTLYPDDLSLMVGILLTCVAAAVVLGIRGRRARTTIWHGLYLVALAGGLTMTMAANLLTLALGSALIDLALMAVVVSSADDTDSGTRMPLSVVVPGVASTLVLFLSALQMDAQVGHASLLSQNLSEGTLVLVGVAAVLRALVFPFHPRRLETPEGAAALLLPVGVGGYLLARVQTLAPVLSDQPWLMSIAAIALLAGSLLAWSSAAGSTERQDQSSTFGGFWAGTLVHQTGVALAFVLLLAGVRPWPWVSLTLALSVLAVWRDGTLETEPAARWEWLERISEWARSWLAEGQSYVEERFPALGPWRDSWFGRHGTALLPAIALASLAGLPFTAGARGRWPFYAVWLERGEPALLIALAADVFLAAGLWTALSTAFKQASERRLRPSALLASIALAIAVLVLGIAPGALGDGVGLRAAEPAGVSAWGLGLLYVLPWLLGAWLARMRGPVRSNLGRVRDVVSLDWLYRVAGWVGRRLEGAIHWLGRVGEGEGWWGWVLIILALGMILLTVR